MANHPHSITIPATGAAFYPQKIPRLIIPVQTQKKFGYKLHTTLNTGRQTDKDSLLKLSCSICFVYF
jgi:hypothetical protein